METIAAIRSIPLVILPIVIVYSVDWTVAKRACGNLECLSELLCT